MRMLNFINKTITYGFYTLLVITPLLFNPLRGIPSYELFEFNKMMFVYALTTLIVAAWGLRMILLKKKLLKRTPFDLPILFFLGSQILSTLFSIDQHVSIFGYYSRFHGGLLSTLSYVLLFYAFVSNRELISIKKLITGALISGFFVAVYGILERFGIDAHIWVQDVQSRVFSTLGQPNWLAAYLAILLPIAVYSLLTVINSKLLIPRTSQKFSIFNFQFSINFSNFKFQIPNYLAIGLFYICLLLTKSRSGFLGFWIANAVFWGLLFWNSSPIFKRFLLLIGGLSSILFPLRFFSKSSRIIMIIVVSTFGLGLFLWREKHYFKRILQPFLVLNASFLILNFFIKTPLPQYNKFASIEFFSRETVAPPVPKPGGDSVIDVGITDSAKIREIVWTGAIEIIKAYPLFGTGPETFAYAYYKYRPAEHNLTSEWDFLYNRAHNEFLNIGATSGLTGLITYLFFIFSVSIWAIKRILEMRNKKLDYEMGNLESLKVKKSKIQNISYQDPASHVILLISFLAAYIGIQITNFFGFSVVVVGLYFFLLPAFIVFIDKKPTEAIALPKSISLTQKIGMGIILLLTMSALFTLATFWVTDSLFARAFSLRRQESLPEAYRYIVSATNLRPDEPVYHDERATIAASLSTLAFENSNATEAAELAAEALAESSKALTISPQNVNFWKARTRILYEFGAFDPSFLASALESITIAKELAPTDAKISYNRAVLLGESQKIAEAIKELENAVTLKSDYRDAYMALSIFYEQNGERDKARHTLELVLQRINPEDAEVKERIEKLGTRN